jgi:3',5'-nucleoside bisphosphate phosphatase
VIPLPRGERADLHTHTTASDGTLTPTELVAAAQAAGISLLAVTDHDTTAGVASAQEAAHAHGMAFIAGVELSAEGPPGKCHLLGLGIDPRDPRLCETLAQLSENRRERNGKMIARLNALGVALTLEDVLAHTPPGANMGRPHFAATLVALGAVATTQEAFTRYLADDASAYITKETLSPADAIALVHEAGGLCFLAHPGLLKLASHETHESRIRALQALGLDGIEAYYSSYSPAEEARFLRLAEKLGLLVTGGSDFHGANKAHVSLGIVRDGKPLSPALLPPELLARA